MARLSRTVLAGVLMLAGAGAALAQEPIAIARQGSFAAGGTVLGAGSEATLHCDHGFVEYQISPTWGGNTGDIKTELDSYSFDHSYLSRK